MRPNQDIATPIGFYSSGCISGADTLPLEGPGFQAMRPSRNRFYGHPSVLQFIQNLGHTLSLSQSGILIGDISQPRGGPMVSGHSSHQVGLDADVWFWTHPEQNTRSLTSQEREELPFISMLKTKGQVDPKKFTTEQILKLKLAALSPNVERIFINPAIKKYLCSTIPEKESAWLHALRPWPGHDAHFHVRLVCPKDSALCVPQPPVAEGNGCNETMNELSPEYLEHIQQLHDETPLAMPAQCEAVLSDPTTKNQVVQKLK